MAHTLTIRLEDKDRKVLEVAAREHGTGLSGFVRQLAEAEAKRLRMEESRRESHRISKYIARTPEARAEIEDWGTPDWGHLGDDEPIGRW